MQATLTQPSPQSTKASARASVQEAVENQQYWKRQSLLRTQPGAIAEAKGLAAAWESTRKARQARLDALTAITTDL